jgi:hypothetical protein
MKKFFLIFVVAMAVVALTAPAMADMKVTTKGYMQVQGLTTDNNIVDRNIGGARFDSTNSYYNMEMIIEPTFHINDKVKIHNKIRIMERNFNGTAAGQNYLNAGASGSGVGGGAYNHYRLYGNATNNFWWEHCYMSFPLWGGTMYVGRMSGGDWAYPFTDLDQDRDRIKYVKRFTPWLLGLAVIGKRAENDGGLLAPNGAAAPVAGTTGFEQGGADQDGYALAAVITPSKNLAIKPLFYWIKQSSTTAPGATNQMDVFQFVPAVMWKIGPFRLDAEYVWVGGSIDRRAAKDIDINQDAIWLQGTLTFGPAELSLAYFWIEGNDQRPGTLNPDAKTWATVGATFQPLLLLFSEDMGFLWNSPGLPNGSANGLGAGVSGFQAAYMTGTYKISDSMKISAALGYVEADEMVRGSHWNGGSADDEIGWELDFSFAWKFMPNVTYSIDMGYLWTGDYYDTSVVFTNGTFKPSENVFGIRHGLRVEW